MDPVSELFDRMDKWRHFPNYQLERRADIFFSLYLPEVLEVRLGFPMNPDLAPEFPVRIGTINPLIETDKSYKIDYLALSADKAESVYVELKTDVASLRDSQKKYLQDSQQVGLRALLCGICKIFRVTNAKRKYFALMLHLEQMGLLKIPNELKTIMAGKSLHGAKEASIDIGITAPSTKPRIVYVQPNRPRTKPPARPPVLDSLDNGNNPDIIISFQEFAEVVACHPDAVSQRFAKSMLDWARVQAGH